MSWFFDFFKLSKGDSSEKVSYEVATKRYLLCDSCEHKGYLVNSIKNCKICGCVIVQKVKYKDEKCPIEKW